MPTRMIWRKETPLDRQRDRQPEAPGQGAGKFLVETMIRRAGDELGVREVRLVCHNVNTGAFLFITNSDLSHSA